MVSANDSCFTGTNGTSDYSNGEHRVQNGCRPQYGTRPCTATIRAAAEQTCYPHYSWWRMERRLKERRRISCADGRLCHEGLCGMQHELPPYAGG